MGRASREQRRRVDGPFGRAARGRYEPATKMVDVSQFHGYAGTHGRDSGLIPVVLETFTFLDRNANRDVALAWKDSIGKPLAVKVVPCEARDLDQSWAYFQRRDLYKLSGVDATSFAIMKRAGIRVAFSFDHHFAMAGFRMVG